MATRWTLTQDERAEQVVKKSRFVAVAAPVGDEAQAKAFIAANSDAGANHNCWAWRVGQAYRFSDDGEPSGTAGKPILQALDGQALDNVSVVVTRWFGGILLGSGGLVRAYGGTAAMCLRAAARIPLLDMERASVDCTFGDAALVHARLLALPEVRVDRQDFTAAGTQLVISVERDALEAVARLVSDLTSGRSTLRSDD